MSENAEKIPDSELEVMKVIWGKDAPTTYAEIRAALGGEDGWDSSTIRTLIRRLVGKGVLKQEKRDVYYYTPTLSEEEFMNARTKEFVHKVYGGNAKNMVSTIGKLFDGSAEAFLSAFLSSKELTPDEINRLKQIVEKLK